LATGGWRVRPSHAGSVRKYVFLRFSQNLKKRVFLRFLEMTRQKHAESVIKQNIVNIKYQ